MLQVIEKTMTPEQFCYWLQGALEFPSTALTKREQMIKDHLNTVFNKQTPNYTTTTFTQLPTIGDNPPQFIC